MAVNVTSSSTPAGLLLKVIVHTASVQERTEAKLALAGITNTTYSLLGWVWADAGYVDRIDQGLLAWGREHGGVEVQIVSRNADVKGFQVLPRRW